MTKTIVIKTQFEGIHQWPDCNIPEVHFLRNPHRHIFHVTMKFKVDHNNREKEFIVAKRQLEDVLRIDYADKDLGAMSCEDIAEKLMAHFQASYVSVFEDNENGAEIYV